MPTDHPSLPELPDTSDLPDAAAARDSGREVEVVSGRRRWSAPWWGVALWVAVSAFMLSLGFWQLRRADEKIALQDAADAARAAAPVPLSSIDDVAAAASLYRRVSVRGRWLPEHQLLWDNRANAGRPGQEVVTPLLLGDGRAILVDRGWIPLSLRREVLPDVSIVMPGDVASSEGAGTGPPVSLLGLLSNPSRGFASGEALVDTAPWPRYLQYFDYPAVARAIGHPLLEAVLQPERDGTAAPLFVENWQPTASGPEKHWSYAVQWFAMTAALAVIFVVVNFRRSDPQGEIDA